MEEFFSEAIADKISDQSPEGKIYGVYSTYDTDATSFYNLTAGVSVNTPNEGYNTVEVQEGKYLVFDAIGSMPAALIQTWGLIWTYFEKRPALKRSFLTDFESYSKPGKVQIYIGVES